ncbi:MAG: YdcF family protein [Leptolyngbyaceae cyanobacterium bins.302]|nr:YdcF family protein [Leptolyngbyaceae cyanobacterium bins.302]
MEVLIFLTVLGITGLLCDRRWRRCFIYPLMGIVLFFWLVLSAPMIALAHWGLVFSLPPDLGDTVDAIVVLGRGEELREGQVEIVNKLWKARRSPSIFVSGMSNAQETINRLKENGLSDRILSGERCSQNTEENAQFTEAVLRPQNVRKILLVTDSPHMLRSLLMFRSFGFTVIPHSSSLPLNWSAAKRMKLILREYAALAKYHLTGRFKERTAHELKHPAPQIIEKLTTWKCQIS